MAYFYLTPCSKPKKREREMYLYIEVFKADSEDVIIRTDVTSKTAKQKTYLRDKYKKDYWGKVVTVQYEKPQPEIKAKKIAVV